MRAAVSVQNHVAHRECDLPHSPDLRRPGSGRHTATSQEYVAHRAQMWRIVAGPKAICHILKHAPTRGNTSNVADVAGFGETYAYEEGRKKGTGRAIDGYMSTTYGKTCHICHIVTPRSGVLRRVLA